MKPGSSHSDPQKVLTIVRDVTARRRAEDALEETRRFNRRVAETIPIVIFVYDLEQRRCVYINDRIKAVLGYSAEDVIAMGDRFLWPAMHPDDRWTVHDPLGGCAAANSSEAIERVFRVRHRNGEWRWVHCMVTVFARFEDGRAKQILGTFTDVTGLKRAEQELHSLSTRLLEVEETEQRRIARELHDGTAQLLFAIGANLANMRKLTGLPANVIGTLGDCQALVDECFKEVRSLSYLLHHPLLEQAGLPAALEWVAEGSASGAASTWSSRSMRPSNACRCRSSVTSSASSRKGWATSLATQAAGRRSSGSSGSTITSGS